MKGSKKWSKSDPKRVPKGSQEGPKRSDLGRLGLWPQKLPKAWDLWLYPIPWMLKCATVVKNPGLGENWPIEVPKVMQKTMYPMLAAVSPRRDEPIFVSCCKTQHETPWSERPNSKVSVSCRRDARDVHFDCKLSTRESVWASSPAARHSLGRASKNLSKTTTRTLSYCITVRDFYITIIYFYITYINIY